MALAAQQAPEASGPQRGVAVAVPNAIPTTGRTERAHRRLEWLSLWKSTSFAAASVVVLRTPLRVSCGTEHEATTTSGTAVVGAARTL